MKKLLIIVLAVVSITAAKAQFISVRTNAPMWLTGTINAGVDIRINNKLSFDVFAAYKPVSILNLPDFRLDGVGVQPALRFWFFQQSVGPFVAVHGTFAYYNLGKSEEYYKGWLAGLGASFGYQWMLNKRWSMGVEVGLSALYISDTRKRYDTPHTDDEYIYRNQRWALAPTKAELSFIYTF